MGVVCWGCILLKAKGELLVLLWTRAETSKEKEEGKGEAKDMEKSQSTGEKLGLLRKGKGHLRNWMILCGFHGNLSCLPSTVTSELIYANSSSVCAKSQRSCPF